MNTVQITVIGAVILAAVGAAIYESGQASRLRGEVRTLQQQQALLNDQVQSLQREQEDATHRLAPTRAEAERLKIDQAALVKLRGELTLLRQQTNELTRQVTELRGNQAAQFTAQAQPSLLPRSVQSDSEKCRDNLRRISGAIEQYALEKKQRNGEKVFPSDIIPYLEKKDLPLCPAGGIYSLRGVGHEPTCSMAGHSP